MKIADFYKMKAASFINSVNTYFYLFEIEKMTNTLKHRVPTRFSFV